ncbi:MAG: hypothetical protein ACK56I_05430 [bacterium]
MGEEFRHRKPGVVLSMTICRPRAGLGETFTSQVARKFEAVISDASANKLLTFTYGEFFTCVA